MRQSYIEVSCDYCSDLISHCYPGKVSDQVRSQGGIVSANGEDFCNKECRLRFRNLQKLSNSQEGI